MPSGTATPRRRPALGRGGERALVLLGLSAVVIHLVVENYVRPQPGTSAADHLASGLIPVGILAGVGAVYPRLRPGVRATIAMTVGAVGIAVGVPTVHYLRHGGEYAYHFTGLVALAGGVLLLLTGPVTLWRTRRRDGSRRRRWARRSLTAAVVIVAVPVVVWFVVFPVSLAYIYTHTGPVLSTPDLRVPFRTVTVTTDDSLKLTASYVRSRNGAAVVLFPGRSRADEARMLIAHGYGVLLLDPRGQGNSEGDPIRWAGAADLLAATKYLQARDDVEPDRVGGFGFSVGGEALLEAAAQSTAIAAVVSEGAGERVGEANVSGAARLLVGPNQAVMSAATMVFSNQRPPPPIVDRVGRIAPRPVLLVYADPGIGGESTRQPVYYDAAGHPKAMWEVPGSRHTGGLRASPAEYERRVVGFFDDALLDDR